MEIVSGGGDERVRIMWQVLCVGGVWSRTEVQGAIHVVDCQRDDVWSPIGMHRCQPAGMPVRSARPGNLSETLLQAFAYLRPGDKRCTIAIEIVLSPWLALCCCHSYSPFL